MLAARQSDGGLGRAGHRVALVGPAHLDVDDTTPVLLALVDDLAGEDVGVADVVELADLARLRHEPAVVAHEVGHVVAEPAVAHHPVVVGHRVADGLGPRRVPVDPLGHVGYAVFVLHVEGGDPLTVLVGDPVGTRLVGHEAVAAGVKDDHVGRRQRPLGHGVQRVADVHVLPVAGLRPADLLRLVDGVDLRDVLVGVGRRLDRGVLPLLPGRLALGVDGQRPRDGDDLGPLIHLDAGVGDEERPLGELGLLLHHRLGATEAVQTVAGLNRAEPLPRAARDEDVDAAEGRSLDPLLRRVAVERAVQGDGDHGRRDLAAPARRRAVVLGGEERIVVPVAAGEVAHGVGRGGGQELPRARRGPPADERLGPLDVVFLELVVGCLLELFGCRGRHCSPWSLPVSSVAVPKEYTKSCRRLVGGSRRGHRATPDAASADRRRGAGPRNAGRAGRRPWAGRSVSPRAVPGRSGRAPGRPRSGSAG